MRLTTLILSALLLAPAAAAVPLSFGVPAQWGPDVEASQVDWVTLIFRGSNAMDAALETLHNVRVREYEMVAPRVTHSDDKGIPTWTYPMMTRNETLPALSADIRGAATWGSLYVAGEGLRLRLAGQPGTLESMPEDRCLPMTDGEIGLNVLYEGGACPPGKRALLIARASEAFSFQLTADRVHEVEWHGLQVACPLPECPSGGDRSTSSTSLGVGNATIHDERYGFTNLQAPDMAVHANGTATIAFVGSNSMDVGVAGWVRLPGFVSSCQECLGGNQTFFASGDIHLGELGYAGQDRLSGDLSGDLAALRLDEASLDPETFLGTSIVSVALGVGAVAVLWKLAAWLATLRPGSTVLENPTRRRILKAIRKHPGIHFRELERTLQCGTSPLEYHLGKLVAEGLVVRRRFRNTVRFFDQDACDQNWQGLSLLRDPAMQGLHTHLEKGRPRARVVQYAQDAWGWSQRTTYRRIKRLLEAGLLTEKRGVLQAEEAT